MKQFVSVRSLLTVITVISAMCLLCAITASASESMPDVAIVENATIAEEVRIPDAEAPTGAKAIAAAAAVGIASASGAIAMGMAISKSTEHMGRCPETAGKINSAMMLGLVFIETLIIYALIVAILIIFVL